MLGSLLGMAPGVLAGSVIGVTTTNQEINGDGFCSLQEAIYAANLDDSIAPDPTSPGDFVDTACVGGDGADIIELPPMSVFTFADPISDADNYVGPSATPIITSEIIIEGRGARLQRHALGRLTRAFVVGGNGFLDLREVHVRGFFIRGGDGGAGGGGGGMGAGGAIYVQGGRLLVQWSTFEANGVRGGNGGDESIDGGGGGGGLSGDGGDGDGSGGGGGGSRGDGGHGRTQGVDYWGGGGGGRVTSGSNETPGEPCGGAGGESLFAIGGDGDSAPFVCPGGGGGGGSGASDLLPGNGGSGSYGGGGGGAGTGPGLTSGDGGGGGFGGGGGGSTDNQGGHGNFGGGGGQGFEAFSVGHGHGGTFAGNGSSRAGGGGAGLGGAIFGYLADIEVVNSTFSGNSAERGKTGTACGVEGCGPGANDGRGAGGAIFTVAGDLTIVSSTIAGNEALTVTNGGGGAIVVYDPEGDDEATLLLRNTIVAGNGVAECYTRNGVDTGGSVANVITNSTDSSTQDSVACVGVKMSQDPGLGPLLLNAPGRTPTMAIGPGSSALNAAEGTVPLDDQRGVSRPQGVVADVGAYEFEAPAPLPPVTTITLTPATPNGSNGWYKTSVGVSITASDFDDAVTQTRCVLDPSTAPASFADLPDLACTVSTATADREHAIYAASVDTEGNVESPVVSATLKIDQTDPTLSPALSDSTIALNQAGVTISPNASDATSGPASASCDPVDTSTAGAHTASCTATDNAGNIAIATVDYVVAYVILGFFEPAPGSKWRAGSSVPVKIALGDADGTRISDAAALQLAVECQVTFSVLGVQSKAAQCMKYDPVNDQFVFTWKLGKRPLGAVTIVVTVSYPGTSSTTELSEVITITK